MSWADYMPLTADDLERAEQALYDACAIQKPKEATMAMRFEENDSVRCITTQLFRGAAVEAGARYVVKSVYAADGAVILHGIDGYHWSASLFELISRAEKAPESALPKGVQRITYTEATVKIGDVEFARCPARYAKTAGAEPTRCALPTRHAHGCAFNHDGHNTTDLQSALDQINFLELIAEEERARAEGERQRANRLGDECGAWRAEREKYAALFAERQTRVQDLESELRSAKRTEDRLRGEINLLRRGCR